MRRCSWAAAATSTTCRWRPAPATPPSCARPTPMPASLSIDTAAAEALPGVHAVVTGADARSWSTPFIVGVRQPMEHWCIATDRVRYAGEPVAIVVAEDRYRAEDALALIDVRYEPLDANVDPEAALGADTPVLHEAVGSNLVSERAFRYGEPEAAFEAAAHTIATTVRYPRNSCTPIECLGLIAAYDPGEDAYDVLSHFQGPLTLHPVMARALKVPGPRLRLRSVPDSGGSFGVKQAVFPLHRRDGTRGAEGRAPGQVDRGPAGAPAGGDLGDQPHDPDRSGGGGRRQDHGAPPRPARGLRRLPACARARDALPQPRQPYRSLPDPPSRGEEPRGRDQQDAHRTQPGFWGAAALLCAGAADAAHRGDARPRPARRSFRRNLVPARRHALPRRRRRRARCRRLSRHPGLRRGGRRARRTARQARRGCGRRVGSTASASPRRWSPASPTWATSPRC